MARRVVVAIVEGATDQVVLDAGLAPLFAAEDMGVQVIFAAADISSDRRTNTSNIRARVNALVEDQVLEMYGLKRSDIVRILRVMDTDGAFVEDSRIAADPAAPRFICDDDRIIGRSREEIRDRNAQKRANMRTLRATSTIRRMSYTAFFMSCDLDHVMHGDANLPSGQAKMKAAHQLEARLAEAPEMFREILICATGACGHHGTSLGNGSKPKRIRSAARPISASAFLTIRKACSGAVHEANAARSPPAMDVQIMASLAGPARFAFPGGEGAASRRTRPSMKSGQPSALPASSRAPCRSASVLPCARYSSQKAR